MKKYSILTLAAASLLLAGTQASAQEITCDDIVWGETVLAQYPDAADACRGVVTNDGRSYVQVEAIFRRMTSNRQAIVFIEERDGDRRPLRIDTRRTTSAVDVEGVQVSWNNLNSGQRLRFYIPPDRFTVVTAPEAAEELMVEVHEEPVAAPAPAPAPEPIAMPTTASNVGAWLVAGIALLLGGLVLVRRG